jgi:NDP-sugar pyrophosphorylase family protein
MKAVILAAGKGARLGTLTATLPKPLLVFRGRPILIHLVELCAAHGIRDLCINTHHLGHMVREALGDGSPHGVRITWSEEDELLGTAGALLRFRDLLEADDFHVLYGDNLMDYDLGALRARHRDVGADATIAFYEKADVSLSGIGVLGPGGRVDRFIEKPRPEEAVSHLVNCGLYVLSPRVFRFIPPGASDFGRDIFPAMLQSGAHIQGVVMDRPLTAVDTPDLYQSAREQHAEF